MTLKEAITNIANNVATFFCSKQMVIPSLTSDSDTDVLAASQGKILSTEINNLSSQIQYGTWTPTSDYLDFETDLDDNGTKPIAIGNYFRIGNIATVNFFIRGKIISSETYGMLSIKLPSVEEDNNFPVPDSSVNYWSGGGHTQGAGFAEAGTTFNGWSLYPANQNRSNPVIYGIGMNLSENNQIQAGKYVTALSSLIGQVFYGTGSITYRIAENNTNN